MSVFGPRRSSCARADYRGFLLAHVAWAATLAVASVIAIAAWTYFFSPDHGTIAAVAASIIYSAIIGSRLIPLAPAVPTCGDEQAIMHRFQPDTDKMLTAPEAEG